MRLGVPDYGEYRYSAGRKGVPVGAKIGGTLLFIS